MVLPRAVRNSYEVFPLWQFLEAQFGIEEAFRLYGPYQGAHISPKIIDDLSVEVSMPLTINNSNYVGTHFGGSLYSMCDPFYMFLLLRNLGPEYIVWDKSAQIEFVKPGRGTVKALFQLSAEEIDQVKKIVLSQIKTTRFYEVLVKDEAGEVVAKVKKELYIRAKNPGVSA